MAPPAEAPFVYAFAALLAIGSVVLVFIPLLRHLQVNGAGRPVFAAVLVGLLGLSIAALVGIVSVGTNPAYFLPLAAFIVVLRIASPTLLYHGIRDRLEVGRSWPLVRILVAFGFMGLALLLAYNLVHVVAGQTPPLIAGLSEQLAMALGASFLIMRAAFRVRPRYTIEWWPIWLSATAFAVAFIIVAPYAFPSFAVAYLVSGLVGWIAAVVALRFSD